jgi:leader peptidase (prepilin peptidase) / N-methyltransferase
MLLGDPLLDGLLGAALGLVIGSYLATLAVRASLTRESRQSLRSRCDHCQRQLAWAELIPVVSFVALRGRCRHCRGAISPVHPAMELACGGLGAACFALGAPLLAPMAWLAVTLAVFDAMYLWLPNRLVAAFAACALIAPAWSELLTLPIRLAGGAIGFIVLWVLAGVYRHVRGREGLGGGDAKLFGAIGLWVGPAGLPLMMLGASAIGLSHAVTKLRAGADPKTTHLPLGTYLAAATLTLIGGKLICIPSVQCA